MTFTERLYKYIGYETTSDEKSNTFPSSSKEIVLLEELVKEMKEIGLNAKYENGYAYGEIKSDSSKEDTLFLMAHVDTSPDASGLNVKPREVFYNGGDIILNDKKVLDPKTFDSLNNHIGHTLIVTDGTTLLGADDKAGVAIIMDAVQKIINSKNYPNIKICFTPDEEIGRGTEKINVDFIKKDTKRIFAYTVDGGDIRGFSYECFNAASATVIVNGVSIHPSMGKGKLINSLEILQEFHSLLPKCRPENTEGREGFIHLCETSGMVEHAESSYILRSFYLDELESYKKAFNDAKEIINTKYNKELVEVTIKDSYRNMKNEIDKNPYVVDMVHEVYKEMGIMCIDWPIRGGTDGANLTYMGIPCPNLGTGGENFHGVFEYVDVDQMRDMIEIIINISNKLK